MAEPVKFDQYAPDEGSLSTAGRAWLMRGHPGLVGRLTAVMERPKFTVAFGIVLLYMLLIFVYLYTTMSHIMFINIPPPEPVPQFVIDAARVNGYEWPTPTPAPAYIMANDYMSSSGHVSGLLLISGVIMLASWPIIALVLHLLTKMFGGRGRYFPDMVSAIGYTYVPKVLAVLAVILVVTQLPIYKVDVSDYGGGDIARYMDKATFPSMAIRGLMFCGLLCSSLLGVAAVRYNGRVGWVAATLVVGMPLAIYLAFTYL